MVTTGEAITIIDRALQSKDALELLASKWRITILHLLREGPLRHGELQQAVDRISSKGIDRNFARHGTRRTDPSRDSLRHSSARGILAAKQGYGRDLAFSLMQR